ncbi:unconventional myosin-Vb-like [Copidosoma floridanum]|uniref:unconventional myosin-Vb-like n=1 Tax=Copidosoma floridanum TaxID=29053 RepID=UPI0006C9D04B|nr:unconventional myosin-Vb-like [Copidosoma floridanum]
MRWAVVVLQRHVRGFLTRLACERWEHLDFVTLDLSVSFFKAVKLQYFEDNRIGKEVRNYGTLKSPKATAKDPRINVSENSNGVSMVGNIYSQKCIGKCENLWAAFRKFDDTANKFIKDFGVTHVEIEDVRALRDRERVHLDTSSDSESDADTIVTTIAPNQTCDVNQSANHHHDHKGMFEFNVTDVDDLVQHLVAEVNYSELEEEARDLPARAVFMCIRYLDAMDDDRAANSLVEAYAKRAKLAVKAQGSFEPAVHWLVQSHRLLNFTKQYSRISYLDLDESLLCHVESPLSEDPLVYHMENTSRQEGHSLCSLELTAERGAIEDVGQWMAGVALEHMRKNTLDLVVPALLDVQRSKDGLLGQNEHLRLLVEKLDGFHRTFQKYGAERRLVIQIFERLFASFSYQALSSFMMRTELFDTLHGTIIRCNIRSLEAWACDCDVSMAIDGLLPIVRTVRLLQRLPVDTSEVEVICADYSELSCDQITYIMIHYKPAQHEEPVSVRTIEGVKAYFASKLRETPDNTMPANDANRPVKFMFRHSEVHFDEVEMPATINLRMLKKM